MNLGERATRGPVHSPLFGEGGVSGPATPQALTLGVTKFCFGTDLGCSYSSSAECRLRVLAEVAFWNAPVYPVRTSGPGLSVCVCSASFQLPGVEACENYTFRYGRNPLMELPLAVNPTGCARSEPKMSAHVKRFVLRYFVLTSHSTAQGF